MFVPYWSGENYARMGLGLYDGTKLITHWWECLTSATTMLHFVYKWNSVTSFSAGITTGQNLYSNSTDHFGFDGHPTWFRIRDDGSTIYFEVSKDYESWWIVSTIGNTEFMTPTKVGVFLEGYGSAKKNGMSLLSWLEE
jgi:hypothetical protein